MTAEIKSTNCLFLEAKKQIANDYKFQTRVSVSEVD